MLALLGIFSKVHNSVTYKYIMSFPTLRSTISLNKARSLAYLTRAMTTRRSSAAFLFAAAALACACALGAMAARDLADHQAIVAKHEQWMAKYGRVYRDAAEKARRLEVFKANVALIESVNARNHKFWLEANQFADLTDDEFRATRTGYKPASGKGRRTTTGFRYANVSLDDIPDSVDWRAKGAVTPIKDQGECGN